MVVSDPKYHFTKIQKLIRFYSKGILQEKIQWLFAEVVFNFEERFIIALKRGDIFYLELIALQVIKLLGNGILLSKGRYPVFEKHLSLSLFIEGEEKFCLMIERFLSAQEMFEKQTALIEIVKFTENRLIAEDWIKKESKEHWIYLRAKYKVEINAL